MPAAPALQCTAAGWPMRLGRQERWSLLRSLRGWRLAEPPGEGGTAPAQGSRVTNEVTDRSAAQASSSDDTVQRLRRSLDGVEGQLVDKHDQADLQSVVRQIGALGDAHVTAAMLREEGFGHRLKVLSKCGHAEVAAAAKRVMKTWKERVCNELQ